jgi:hypothetical protein
VRRVGPKVETVVDAAVAVVIKAITDLARSDTIVGIGISIGITVGRSRSLRVEHTSLNHDDR